MIRPHLAPAAILVQQQNGPYLVTFDLDHMVDAERPGTVCKTGS